MGGVNLYGFLRNNGVRRVDVLGRSELDWEDYADNVLKQVNGGQHNFDIIFKNLMKQYLASDTGVWYFTDCQDDMEEIWEAMNELVHGDYGDQLLNHGQHLQDTPGYGDGTRLNGDGSDISHFFAGASWAGLGKIAQDTFEEGLPLGFISGPFSPDLGPGDRMRDTAAAYLGVEFADIFDTWTECKCRCIAKKFANGEINFSSIFGGANHNQVMRNLPNRNAMEKWVKERAADFKSKIDDC